MDSNQSDEFISKNSIYSNQNQMNENPPLVEKPGMNQDNANNPDSVTAASSQNAYAPQPVAQAANVTPQNYNQPPQGYQQPYNPNIPPQGYQQPYNPNIPPQGYQQPYNPNIPPQGYQQPYNPNIPPQGYQQPYNPNVPHQGYQQPYNPNILLKDINNLIMQFK